MSQPDNRYAELLEHYLEAWEDAIRGDLAGLAKQRGTLFRGEPKQLRLLDFTAALEALAPARVALAQCPEGAELAIKVLDVALDRLRAAAELGNLHYKGARKGAIAATAKRRRRVARTHVKLRAVAAKLSPDLSKAAKAKIMAARDSNLSERQIRRIIQK